MLQEAQGEAKVAAVLVQNNRRPCPGTFVNVARSEARLLAMVCVVRAVVVLSALFLWPHIQA
jgi:hypothetical protein